MRVPAQIDSGEPTSADLLVGRCSAMQEVYKAIGRVAAQDVTVLILGESGSGKELVARAIYHYSRRAHGPFLAINCAAIPEGLLESELFGHEKGSFTGADRKRIGKFEQCRSGTLFLDEIGDMTPLTQTKILRVLQEKEFERVGGNEVVQTDVRLIAATNRNLEQAIDEGHFRSDLYYRLNDYTIRIPPLRERMEDLPLLVEHFLNRLAKELNKRIDLVEPRAMEMLAQYSWPGNIRELQSAIKHAVIEATGSVIVVENLPQVVRGHASEHRTTAPSPHEGGLDLHRFINDRYEQHSTNLYEETVRVVEKSLLLDVLHREHNNLTQAARVLGISRTTLRAKLASHGVTMDRNPVLDSMAGIKTASQ
jgi:two-component system nitrogen regulation response regulator GlnG